LIKAYICSRLELNPEGHALMTESTWNPQQYLKFGDQRLRPAMDLLDRIPLSSPDTVYDLGCGTGHVTRVLSKRWPSASVIGVDYSRRMLDKAQSQAGRVRWLETDVEEWVPERAPDLIYSNATLHWVPDHDVIMPRLAAFIKPGGCLALQMPLSFDLPSHRLLRETLAGGDGSDKAFESEALRLRMNQRPVQFAAYYYDMLSRCSGQVDVWETEYLHVLEGNDPVLEWVKGTGLRPVLSELQGDERERFLEIYRSRLLEAYPKRSDGRTLYPFRRLFVIAQL
jgi:trans-aconitate 2-methyltransferase